MFIEEKSHLSEPSTSQRETLSIFRQILNPSAPKPFRKKVLSKINKMNVDIVFWGHHLLQFANTGPEDGLIFWDHKRVSIGGLEDILRFDVNPYTLNPISNHEKGHHPKRQRTFDGRLVE
jgi:hypothetical protein